MAAEVGPYLASRRKTITLPESGLEVVLRVFSHLDRLQIEAEPESKVERGEGDSPLLEHFLLRSIETVVMSPKVRAVGMPNGATDVLHIRDLSDRDVTVLISHVTDFALGGARSATFQAADGGAPDNARPRGKAVRPSSKRGRRSAASRL